MKKPQRLHWWMALFPIGICAVSLSAQDGLEDLDEDIYELSPFEIVTTGGDGYLATDTLAGTRVRTDLKDVASSISVVTAAFLQDTGARNVQDLLVYTTNTEVGGVYGNYAGVGNTFVNGISESANFLRPSSNTRVRGLDSADNTREFFQSHVPWDSYNVARVELQRGPNSILFGIGSPAGIINSALNGAEMGSNHGQIENRISSYNSVRYSADYNHIVIDDLLSVRVAALDDHSKYRQKPAYNHDRRVYGALRFEPKLFEKGNTTIRANFEHGEVRANRPRVLPPFDSISPFFYSGPNDFNKQTVDPTFAWVAQLTPSSNATREEVAENGYTQIAWLGTMPGIQGSQNPIFTYDSPSSVDPSRTYTGTLSTWYGINADGEIDHGIGGFPFGNNIGIMGYSTWARYEGLPAADKNFYKDRHLTDTSIFNFYDYLIDGPNKKEWQNWQTYNLNLIQTFFSDRLGVEFVYDVQEYDDGQSRSLGDPVLSVDIRSNYLNYPWSYAEAVPNPDAGRAFVATGGRSGGNNSNITKRANVRGTVFGELRADDLLDKSLLTDIIGRHTFTGLYSKETYDSENRNWVKWAVDQRYPEDVGTGVSGSGTGGELNSGRTVDVITYLSGDLRGRNTAAGLNLRPLTVIQSPLGSANISYFDSHWNAPEVDPAAIWYDPSNIDPESDGESTESENPLNYVGWVNGNYDILNGDYGDRANLLTDVNRIRKITESAGFTWQGYWFQDLLVSTFGWRRDEQKLLSGASSLSDSATGHATINPAFDPYDPEGNFSSGESISWGVVAHSPEFIKKRLPWNSNISLSYSSGKNSRVENRYGFDGNELPNAAGKTTDIGVALSLLDNRLQIKATWYETEVEDANIASVSTGSSTLGGDTYYVYLLESWGTASALTNLAGAAGDAPGYEWYWNWAAINADWDEAYNDPKGELFMNDPLTAQMLEASHSWLSQLQPQSWFDAYGMDVNVALAAAGDYKNALLRGNWAAGNIGGIQAAGAGRIRGVYPTGTVDNKSEGVEIEITGQPIDGLSLSLNVSKTNAFQTALGESLVTFIEGAYQKYQTPAGDLRLWWGGDRTVREYFESVWAAYQFQLETNGKLVAEMSPWRANMVANYTFKNGRLNGLNLGGGVRWQDKAVVGYPLNEEQDNLNVDKPYWSDARHWVDLWAGYERQLTDKIKWRLQLNLRNVGKDISLVPISVQPDGTPAQYRIEEGMTWSITNTFSF